MPDYSYCENEVEAAAERAFDDSLGTDPDQDYRDAVAHYAGKRGVSAMLDRGDLLAKEAQIVSDRKQNWAGRLRDIGDYGRTGGGSPADRRAIVEYMAALEANR